ncbi:MAG: hypothetical protein AAGF50_01980 [Pseudomonadota bacterium]
MRERAEYTRLLLVGAIPRVVIALMIIGVLWGCFLLATSSAGAM